MKNRQQILVVDDNPDTLLLMRFLLEAEDFRVTTVASGRAAMTWLEHHRPDLILLDIAMPDINGIEVLHHVRNHLDIPVLMVSADHDTETLKKAFEYGADDYVKKPFSTRVLLARINSKLRRTSPVS